MDYKKILLYAVLIFLVIPIRGNVYSQYKLLPPDNYIYAGVFPDMGGTEDSVTAGRLEEYKKLSGHKPVWVYFSNNWFGRIKFPSKEVQLIKESGSIPYIRMLPRSNFGEGKQDPVYRINRFIEGIFDDELLNWARDAKKTGIPLLVEFAPEMNGNWFPWSGIFTGGGKKNKFGSDNEADGPERYKAAYRHIIDLFREEGVNNITWVYHPNALSDPQKSWNTLKSYYPGDDYIDWIGVSIYGSQKPGWEWTQFTDIFDGVYKELCEVSDTKPLTIVEFGVVEDAERGNKANWLKAAFDSFVSGRYPRIQAISYWHSRWRNPDGTISNMRIDSSPDVLEVYRAYINGEYFSAKPVFSQ